MYDCKCLLWLRAGMLLMNRYSLSPPDLSFIPEDERPQVVTECWVEACASAQRIIPLDSHVCFTPLKGDFPIPGLGETDVHVAGFSGPDRVYLKRLARVVGTCLPLGSMRIRGADSEQASTCRIS